MNSFIEKSFKKINNSAKNVFNLNLTTINNKIHTNKNINKDYSDTNNSIINNLSFRRKNKFNSKPKKSSVLNESIKLNTSRHRTTKKFCRDNDFNNNSNNENNLLDLIDRIKFNNLNEYYKIESNIFMKKIQRLNLKFYYTSELLLKEKNIKYPYDELFLILFKEISLYIEEIERLNKLLLLKSKNEINYNKKLQKLELKEKNSALSKQNMKNLKNKINLLQKENERYKNNIDKLNKQLNSYNNINKSYNINNNNISNNNSEYGIKSLGNSTLDSFNSPQKKYNIFNSGKKDKIKKGIQFEINEIIKHGIKQCSDELNNLSKIEELLINNASKKNNKDKKK